MFRGFRPETEEDRSLLQELAQRESRKQLTEPVSCRPAEEKDLERILEIRDWARESLRRHGVDQWQGPYPEASAFLHDMERNEGFVVLHGGDIAAYFALTDRPEPDYANIRDGKWTEGLKACILHRSAVAKEYRGTGIADAVIRFCEELTLEKGFRCIRSDTHRKNKSMLRLLREHGFRYRGNITIESEPGHDPARQCFEKVLKSRKPVTDGFTGAVDGI